jgi:integrase
MGKRIERLTSTQVRAAKPKADGKDKLYSDGGGLFLRAGQSKSGDTTRNWFFKYTTPEIQPNGRHYEPSLGLGSADTVALADARQAARDADRQRREAWRGWKPGDPRPANDPVERNRLVREARKSTMAIEEAAAKTPAILTFDKACDCYVDQFGVAWKNKVHRRQWIDSVQKYVCPHFGTKGVNAVTLDDVLACLTPIWMRIPETASRVRGRIEAVLDFAGRQADNPARWAVLRYKLPRRNKARTVEHFKAAPYQEVPGLMAELRSNQTVVSLALQLLILTGVRRGELLGNTVSNVAPATWQEINLDAKLWIIPRHRTKRDKEHRVPLSDAAMEILHAMAKIRCDDMVFPVHPLSIWYLLRKLRPGSGYTCHGFRSCLRDFAGDQTNFDRAVAEAALAHSIRGVEGAYRRGDALEKRRQLMAVWADYCCGTSPDNVVPLRVA